MGDQLERVWGAVQKLCESKRKLRELGKVKRSWGEKQREDRGIARRRVKKRTN